MLYEESPPTFPPRRLSFYIPVDRKGTPFVYLLLTNDTPSNCRKCTISYRWINPSLTVELIPKTGSIRQSFTALTSVIPFGFLKTKKNDSFPRPLMYSTVEIPIHLYTWRLSLYRKLVPVYYPIQNAWGVLDTRPTSQHCKIIKTSIWAKATIFRVYPVGYHRSLKSPSRWCGLVWTRASNPTIRCLTLVLKNSWVLSYLLHRNSPPQKLLEEWVQVLGTTISGILWVDVS